MNTATPAQARAAADEAAADLIEALRPILADLGLSVTAEPQEDYTGLNIAIRPEVHDGHAVLRVVYPVELSAGHLDEQTSGDAKARTARALHYALERPEYAHLYGYVFANGDATILAPVQEG